MVMITQRPAESSGRIYFGSVRSDVAHALVGAVSAFVPKAGVPHEAGVEKSLDTARTSACATLPGEDVVEMMLHVNDVIVDEELQRYWIPSRCGIVP